MSDPRKPASFRVEPTSPPAPGPTAPPQPEMAAPPPPRRPRSLKGEAMAAVVPAEFDVFDKIEDPSAPPPPATPPRRKSWLSTIFISAFGLLVSLALGLWVDRLVRDLFSRSDWLGWAAFGLALIAAAALILILVREATALLRLGSIEKLRARATEAIFANDQRKARAVTDDLVALLAAKPQTAAGRKALAELRDDIIDGADLVRLAEMELLAPLDRQARQMILDAAKRVSVVTAVSPRALVDIAYVLFEAGRLVRRLAELYGGRPGTLGFIRLARNVLAHLAVTGAIAAGDEFVHQIVGQGLAARLSAKLGEGVVNGMMTARIGVAAMDVVRPLPFAALKRPGMSDFLAALGNFIKRRETARQE